jgi:hypothetical protein
MASQHVEEGRGWGSWTCYRTWLGVVVWPLQASCCWAQAVSQGRVSGFQHRRRAPSKPMCMHMTSESQTLQVIWSMSCKEVWLCGGCAGDSGLHGSACTACVCDLLALHQAWTLPVVMATRLAWGLVMT